ncbi:MAG TPA: hypothetical protein VF452_11095 [Candidatus Binatia bacterium]
MKRTIGKFIFGVFISAVFCAGAASAWAKDAVVSAVSTPLSPPNPIIIQNGTQYSQGTYAIGTIQLFYTVPAYQFPAGNFGYFTLDLSIQGGKATPPTNYPVNLTLKQTGSANLDLDPVTENFNVDSVNWHGSTRVNINIPAAVASNPSFQVDGAELVGNLQMVTPSGSHLDTVTTIQIHLILTHPTDCLKAYSFITNNDNTAQVNPIQVSKQSNNHKVSSNPQNPHYILVITNTCSVAQCMDTRFGLNNDFELKGAQAVKTFSSNSLLDSFSQVSSFFSGSPIADPHGTSMCLTAPATTLCGSGGIPVLGGESYLIKADINIRSDASFPPPAKYTGFDANLLDGGSTNNCTVPGTLNSVADPNPISSELNAQCVSGSGKVSCTP